MFSYHADVIERYPTIRAGVVHATGLSNGPSPAALQDEFRTQQAVSRSAMEGRSMAEVPSIAAWRRAFSSFGVKPTQYRNAAEALLRRLVKRGDIPSINLLVDIANLVAVRYALPVAAFDQAHVAGSTQVCFAEGSEQFTDLGSGRVVSPRPGEVVFVDQAGLVSARRWCWRQSRQSATGPQTVEALFTVEGHHDRAADDVAAASNDISRLLGRYQPDAQPAMAQLSPDNPRLGYS